MFGIKNGRYPWGFKKAIRFLKCLIFGHDEYAHIRNNDKITWMIKGYDWCSYCTCYIKQPVRIRKRKKKGIIGWYDSATETWYWENTKQKRYGQIYKGLR